MTVKYCGNALNRWVFSGKLKVAKAADQSWQVGDGGVAGQRWLRGRKRPHKNILNEIPEVENKK